MGLDMLWRRSLARFSNQANSGKWLDLATGTGEMADLLTKHADSQTEVYALDFSQEMLNQARKRNNTVKYIHSDIVTLPFEDNYFDLITISLATRNINSAGKLETFLAETYRVLKPDGIFLHLETTRFNSKIFQMSLRLYVNIMVKKIISGLSNHKEAYKYLGESVLHFYSAEKLKNIMRETGFKKLRFKRLFPGMVAIHEARKKKNYYD